MKKERKNYRYYITCSITFIFLLVAVFVFPNAWVRFVESLVDFGTSFAFYFQELFYAKWNVNPTVVVPSKIGWTPIFGLPATWEEFQILWAKYWQVFATKENFIAYLDFLSTPISPAILSAVKKPMPLISFTRR